MKTIHTSGKLLRRRDEDPGRKDQDIRRQSLRKSPGNTAIRASWKIDKRGWSVHGADESEHRAYKKKNRV